MDSIGVFETMRFKNGKCVYLEEHLSRLMKSLPYFKIKLPLDKSKFRDLVLKRVRCSGNKDLRLKIIIRPINGKIAIYVSAGKYRPYTKKKYRQGFKVVISPLRQNDLQLAQHKTTKRVLYDASLFKANRLGADEALILNKSGFITEAARSNLFFVSSGVLYTPSLDCGCLKGVTRQVIIGLAKKAKIKVREGWFRPAEFFSAEEAFLTNSLIGVMPIKGKCGRITSLLLKKYGCLLN